MSGSTKIWREGNFARDMRKAQIPDQSLFDIIDEIEQGLAGKNLGDPASDVKIQIKRLAREGGGKSGGYRTVVLIKHHDFAVFLLLYARKDDLSITDAQKRLYRKYAAILAELPQDERDDFLISQGFDEVSHVTV